MSTTPLWAAYIPPDANTANPKALAIPITNEIDWIALLLIMFMKKAKINTATPNAGTNQSLGFV